MRIQILGSASGMPVADRNSSCYRVQAGHKNYILDAGDGVARQMIRFEVDPLTVEAVFISHTHPDHVSGLFMLMQLTHLSGRKIPLPIYLPRGVLPGFESVFPFFQIYKENWPFKFSLRPIADGTEFKDGPLQWRTVLNDHLQSNGAHAARYNLQAASYSFILGDENNRQILYTSDLVSLDCLADRTDNSQYLLVESTHISWENAVRFAENHQIKQIYLTHVPPSLEEIELPETSVPVTIIEDGQWIEV